MTKHSEGFAFCEKQIHDIIAQIKTEPFEKACHLQGPERNSNLLAIGDLKIRVWQNPTV
ncbi:hypothetical protein H6764_02455 [Candidatus Nomurabacteria bacterium]|nr:hypothetical protein [Candidatus Nomurabacteria bacterium]